MQFEAKVLVLILVGGAVLVPAVAMAQPNQYQYQGQQNADYSRSPGYQPPVQQQQQGYPGPYQSQSQSYPVQPGAYPPPGGFPPQQQPYSSYPAGYVPGQAQPAGFQNPGEAQGKVTPQQQAKVFQWFQKYDDVRRRAQMNPVEKQQADAILSKGLSILMPGPEKLAAKDILSKLVMRYDAATKALEALPVVNETKRLQQGYYQYFSNARGLFSDYLRVQDNLMARDANGQPIMAQLMQRKQSLEQLERACKDLDAQTRACYGVPAYQY